MLSFNLIVINYLHSTIGVSALQKTETVGQVPALKDFKAMQCFQFFIGIFGLLIF